MLRAVDELTLKLAMSMTTTRGQRMAIGSLLAELPAERFETPCPFCRSAKAKPRVKNALGENETRCTDCDKRWIA